MIWFTLHHLIKFFFTPYVEQQTRNLSTFLIGVVLYTLYYSLLGSMVELKNSFLGLFVCYSHYIILADGFAMGVLYKNFYKQTIFTEVKETFGAPPEAKVDAVVAEPDIVIT